MPPATVISKEFAELTATELHDILQLRGDVFVVEQQCAYADVDGRDTEATTRHHWIERDGSVAAYARTMVEAGGAVRIGRVVTAPTHRGCGLATRLLAHLVGLANGAVVLDAQSYLVEWYEQMGFTVGGPEFVEDGIPHVPMGRVSGDR